MATNKIYFNNQTTPIILRGVYYNGTKIEGCKGIKLNGTVVVSFGALNWSDYTNAYNAVWIDGDTTNQMAKMTAENEFAICRSAWTLYTRNELINIAGVEMFFNFNSDGRLYIGDDATAQNWMALLETYTEPITMASVHSKIPLYSMLTGLPLIYKKEDSTFASTRILSENDDGSYDISYNNGKWTIVLADLSVIKSPFYETITITEVDIANAIKNTLGVTATGTAGSGNIIITAGAENWGEFEFLDALSNVYVPGFGPFYEDSAYPPAEDELYCLIPNDNFLAQSYWKVNITSQIRLKNPFLNTLNPCDFYILTGWGLQYILDKTESTIDEYFAQGENNAEVNITYFDTSCFAGLQYPNILCKLNSSYSDFRPDYIFTSGNWAGIQNTGDYGAQTTAPVFPTDCPYSIGDLTLSDLTNDLPSATTEWIADNSLQNVKVTCTLNQTAEVNYRDGSDMIPESIASVVFEQYKQNYITSFPYNNPSNPTKIVEYVLKLKMRTYPSYATGNSGTGATAETKWYLNAYDPYNVGGYYPVKKTEISAAGNMYKTNVNYTAQ